MKRRMRLTEENKHAIRLALRFEYTECMRELDMHNAFAGTYLRMAGAAWAAYKAVAGYPLEFPS